MNRMMWGLFVFITGFLIYKNTLSSPFQFDDLPFIQFNPAITDITNLQAIRSFNPPRIIGNLSFAMNYLFGGLNPVGFHIVNVIIHIVTALLVGVFVGIILRRIPTLALDEKRIEVLGRLSTLLFLVHPLHTTAVNHITQRYTSMIGMFFMLAMVCYATWREKLESRDISSKKDILTYSFGFFAAVVLAMFTKQTSFMLPIVIVVFELYFYAGSIFKRYKRLSIAVLIVMVLLVPAIMNFSWQSVFIPEQISQSHDLEWVTPFNYLWTELRIIPQYISLLFYPVHLNFDYDISLSQSFFEPNVVIGTCLIIILIFVGIFHRRRQPLISFGIFWFFLNLVVESTIIPLPYVMTEYRAYLPSVGWILVILGVCINFLKNPKLISWVLMGCIGVFSFLTIQRNEVWKDTITLWSDTVAKSPHKSRPHINLGAAYYLNKDYDKALEQFSIASTMSPNNALIFYNIGCIYKDKKDFPEALQYLERAVLLAPQDLNYQRDLAFVYTQLAMWEKALAVYQNIVLKDTNVTTLNNFARSIIKFYIASEDKNRINKYLEFLHKNNLIDLEHEIIAYIAKLDLNHDK